MDPSLNHQQPGVRVDLASAGFFEPDLHKQLIEQEKARRTRLSSFLTIDTLGTKICDSAVFVEKFDPPRPIIQSDGVQRGRAAYLLQVAIADVPWIIPRGSALDQVAAERLRSRYPTGESSSEPLYPLNLLKSMSLDAGQERLAVMISLHYGEDGRVINHTLQRVTVVLMANLSDDDVIATLRAGEGPFYEQVRAQWELARLLRLSRYPLMSHFEPRCGLIFEDRSIKFVEPEQLAPVEIREETAIAVRKEIARVVARSGKAAFPYRTQSADLIKSQLPRRNDTLSSFLFGLSLRALPPQFSPVPSHHFLMNEGLYGPGTAPLRSYASKVALQQYLFSASESFGEPHSQEEVDRLCSRLNEEGIEPGMAMANAPSLGSYVTIHPDNNSITPVLRKLGHGEFFNVISAALRMARAEPNQALPWGPLLSEARERLQKGQLKQNVMTLLAHSRWEIKSKQLAEFLFDLGQSLIAGRVPLDPLLISLRGGEPPQNAVRVGISTSSGKTLYSATMTSGDPRVSTQVAWSASEAEAIRGVKLICALYLLGLKDRASQIRKAFYTKRVLNMKSALDVGDEEVINAPDGLKAATMRLLVAVREGYVSKISTTSKQQDNFWECQCHILLPREMKPISIPAVRSETKEYAKAALSSVVLRSLIEAGVVPKRIGTLDEEWIRRQGRRLVSRKSQETTMTILLDEILERYDLGRANLYTFENGVHDHAYVLLIAGGVVFYGFGGGNSGREHAVNQAVVSILKTFDAAGFGSGSIGMDPVARLYESGSKDEFTWELFYVEREPVASLVQFMITATPGAAGNSQIVVQWGRSEEEVVNGLTARVLKNIDSVWKGNSAAGIEELVREGKFVEALNTFQREYQPYPFAVSPVISVRGDIAFYEASCTSNTDSGAVTTYGRGTTIALAKAVAARRMLRALGEVEPEEWEHPDELISPDSGEQDSVTKIYLEKNRYAVGDIS